MRFQNLSAAQRVGGGSEDGVECDEPFSEFADPAGYNGRCKRAVSPSRGVV